MLDEKIKKISIDFDTELQSVQNLQQLEELRIKFIGRNGLISSLFDELKNAPQEEKPVLGHYEIKLLKILIH